MTMLDNLEGLQETLRVLKRMRSLIFDNIYKGMCTSLERETWSVEAERFIEEFIWDHRQLAVDEFGAKDGILRCEVLKDMYWWHVEHGVDYSFVNEKGKICRLRFLDRLISAVELDIIMEKTT